MGKSWEIHGYPDSITDPEISGYPDFFREKFFSEEFSEYSDLPTLGRRTFFIFTLVIKTHHFKRRPV